MKHTVAKTIKIWWHVALMAAQSQLSSGWSGIGFILGKIFRILLFFVFLFTILQTTKNLANYNQDQVIWFFLVFTFIDSLIQFVFRGVYQFRALVLSGNYDLDLLKPLPTFFRPLFGWADFQDLVILIPLVFSMAWFVITRHLVFSFPSLLLFLFLIIVSMSVALGLHLFIISLCILTTEIDHLVMIYRDVQALARFPTDIYAPVIQTVITYVVPIVVMITIPAKALLGPLSFLTVASVCLFAALFCFLAFRLWYFALARYSSASS